MLQPVVVAIAAIHDGIKDARIGRSLYFWTIFYDPQSALSGCDEALNATARIILLGVVMDVIYQFIVLTTFYPVEALIVALLFAFVPYLLIRGPAARIARRWRRRPPACAIRSQRPMPKVSSAPPRSAPQASSSPARSPTSRMK